MNLKILKFAERFEGMSGARCFSYMVDPHFLLLTFSCGGCLILHQRFVAAIIAANFQHLQLFVKLFDILRYVSQMQEP